MKRVLTVFLLSIFLASAVSCAPHDQNSMREMGQLEITEGYVLSKHSDYKTDDRYYTRGDTLYVWVWSSRIIPYDVVEHHCWLTLDGYVHKFYLNYDPEMTRQYSYTGSFNLSRLEKTGNWTVEIFLKSKPPKPIIFNSYDMIHVSAPAKPTHTLGVISSPISGVSFTINEVNRTTPFLGFLIEGNYTVCVPLTVHVNGKAYNFARWGDETTEPIRSINLTKDMVITAHYNPPRETSTIKGKISDHLGNPIIGAKVTILETQQHVNTSAEPAGYYEFTGLSPGTYTIRVEISEYNPSWASVVADPAGTYARDFYLKPMFDAVSPLFHYELWQVVAGSLALFGATAYLVLWRRRGHTGKEIGENEYRIVLEGAKLEAMLQELKNLLEKGLVNSEEYETTRREMNEELTKIRSQKN